MPFIVKTLVTALIITMISELSKRSTLVAGIAASLPLTSILAMIWIYEESSNLGQVSRFSWSVFWMVIPSLLFFLALPILIRAGIKFLPALALSCLVTSVAYWLYWRLLTRVGIEL